MREAKLILQENATLADMVGKVVVNETWNIGEIVYVGESILFPIFVMFRSGYIEGYTSDGYCSMTSDKEYITLL
jgi:hypothetical protein